MKLLEKVAQEYGAQQIVGRYILPKLAMDVAAAAKKGEITAEDAAPLFAEYLKGQGMPGREIDPAQPSFCVQASKLRQIIRAADPELLRRVVVQRDALPMGNRRPLYHSMVDVCRLQLMAGKPLSDKRIREIASRKR